MGRNRLLLIIVATCLGLGIFGVGPEARAAETDMSQRSSSPAGGQERTGEPFDSEPLGHSRPEKIDLATVCVNDLCGYVNSQGEWHIPPKFRAADPFSPDGVAFVIVNVEDYDGFIYVGDHKSPAWAGTPYGGAYNVINTNGDFVLDSSYWELRSFAPNGLAAVQTIDDSETKGGSELYKRRFKWGFVNIYGQWVIEPQFDIANSFADNGLAAAKTNGLWGLINTQGQWVVEPKFDIANSFADNGLAAAKTNGLWGLINTQGQWVVEPKFSQLSLNSYNDKISKVKADEKWGFIDASGQWVIEPSLDQVSAFSTYGLAAAKINGKNGLLKADLQWVLKPGLDYINGALGEVVRYKKGDQWGLVLALSHTVIEPQFDDISEWSSEGLIVAQKNNKKGLINYQGQWVVQPKFDKIGNFSRNGLAPASANGRWGVINTSGQWVVQPKFDKIWGFSQNGLAPASVNGQWGYINTSGQWVIDPVFDKVDHFEKSPLAAVKKKGQWGLINSLGQWAFKPNGDKKRSTFFIRGLSAFESEGKFGFINKQGQWEIQPKFDHVGVFTHEGLASAAINGQWGLINRQGDWVLEPKFKWPINFVGVDMAVVELNGQWGLINKRGEWLAQPQFDYIGDLFNRFGKYKARDQSENSDDDLWDTFIWPENALILAEVNGRAGFINSSGQWIIKPKVLNSVGRFSNNLYYGKIRDQKPWAGAPFVIKGSWSDTALKSLARQTRNKLPGRVVANCYIDAQTGAYRTGLNRDPEEPGFSWDFSDGSRTLYNRQGEKILIIDLTGENEVAKNARGEIIWP